MELVNVEEDCRRVINMVIKDYNNVLVWKILDREVLKKIFWVFLKNYLKLYINLDVEYLNNILKVIVLIYRMLLFWK